MKIHYNALKSALALLILFVSGVQAQVTCTFPNQTVAAANTVLNTYYPGTANAVAGATSITVGAATGSATAIAAGDLVMIIQMQGATQNSNNTTSYGDGVAGAPASGFLVAVAGTYEYGIAINAVPLAGGTLNLLTGTANAYTNAAATGTQGQITYQVIRVPRFNNLTINAAQSITCTAWNGSTGGVVALDVNGVLNMNTTGTIHANARGFRGGGGRQLGGGGGANTDIRTNATVNTNGAKGEGICGTPRYVYNGTALVNTGVEGYPNGSNASGAPGNAGGGGTDADPANNQENTGGGGGGNAGTGGRGGRSWNSNLNIGGYGGIAPGFLATTRVIMGGGGGAGTTNNGTGSLANGLSSSGGTGGGLIILKVNTITNAGTVTANGAIGLTVDNDGGGGGGSGGTIYISATVPATLATLTANAIGGNGGNAWATQADAGGPNDGNPEHGPGGGGGGGAIYSNGNLVGASSVAGGTNGITTTSNHAFGATAGTVGVKNQAAAAITFPTLPNPTAASNSPICVGGTLNLTSTPTIGTATYSWTGPNSFASALQNPSIVGATAAAAGTYSVSYTLGTCTAGPATTAVVVNAAPTTSNAGPDASVCGLVATLAGNTPLSGTGTWTLVAGPGTAVFSNANSPTSNVTVSVVGAYTFRWTISAAPCGTSQDNVVITFVANPTTSNAGPDQTICTTGGSATMAGNVPTVGTGTWTQISGPVTGTITTPGSATTTITGLTTAGTYVFQWSIANAPCTSSTDQVSVIVNAPPTTSNAGPDASVCGLTTNLAGNVPTTGTGTWTQVAGPGTSVFVNANLATTSVTVSVAGAYTFRWTIANAPCTASQDNVIITFVANPTTSNAGPDQTICTTGGSATMAGNVPTIGTGTWTQISGPVTGTITTPGSATTTITGLTTAGTYVFQWSIANAPCASSTDQVSVIVNAPPTTSNAGPDASVCGLTTNLAGNVPTTGTGTWTQVAGPGTSVFVNANLATTSVTVSVAGAYTFRWTIANAPCTASQDNVIITFVAAPTTANAGPDQTICTTGGSATMAGNVPTVGTGTWTQVSGPVTGTITTPGSATTTITGLTTAGTYVFQWSIANAPCASSTDQVSIIVNAPPTTSNAGPDATVCGLTTNLAGNVPTTGTGTWTQVAGPGTSVFVNANLATTSVTVSVAGAYTFRWTIANAPCTASQDNVIITFVANPTTSNAGPDQTICTTGGSATMAGNVPTVGTGTWTQISGPVTGTITTPGSATTTITGLTTAGTYVFQWSIANAPCASSTDQISVIVNAPPTTSNAGPDFNNCGLTATLAGNTPTTGTGTWTLVAGPGTAVFSNANSPTSNVTVSVVGVYTFRWTIANAPCTASQDNVIVTFASGPTTANAGPDQTICTTGGSATMAGNVPVTGTGTWTQISGPVTATITTPGANNTTITGMTTAGTYVFQWTIIFGSCLPSTDQVTITVNAPPTASNAGPDASVCGLTTNLAGNVPTTGTGTWTQVAGPGTSAFVNANLATTSVTVSVAGAYTFRWTIANAPCTASQDNVIITFVANPTTSNAGPDQTICTTGGSATMAGNVPTVGTGTWTQISGPVTATITTPGANNTTITGMTTAGTYVFQWTIANAPCASSTDQVSIIVNAPPTASNAGPDFTLCGLTATLAGNAPTTGTGTWTLVAGPGTAVFSNANSPTSNVTVSIIGVYTFRWTIANAPCTASQDNVIVTFTTGPTTANAGPDQTICTTTGSATMAGNIAVIGTGTWTQISGPVTATITTPGANNTTITGLTTAGTYVFQWSIANPPCAASTDQITITVNAPPTASNAGPDASVCGLTTNLAGNVPTTGTGTWTQVAGPGTSVFTNANLATTSVTVSVAGAYTFRWTITNAPCTASQDNVIITFVATPTVANAGPDQTICSTTGSAVMAGNIPTVGTGTWTQISGPVTATITTPGSNATTITGLTTAGTYVFQWSIANAPCAASTDQITIIVNAPPTASNAGPAQSVCGLTGTLAGNTPTVGTGTWTQTAGPGTSTFTNANSPTSGVTVSVIGVYTYTWTIANAPCASSQSTVNVTFTASPSAAVAGADQSVCSLSTVLAATAATTGTGTWSTASGPGTITFSNVNTANATATASAYGTYALVWTVSNAPCPANTDTVLVTFVQSPTVAAAGIDSTHCGLVITLYGNTPTVGTGVWTLVSGPGTVTFTNPNSPTTNATITVIGTYVFQWTITNAPPCAASSDQISITFQVCDSDGDGIPDNIDLDDDNDGIPDTIEGSADTDGDGIPDSLDLDSDNDGIPDVTEAGGTDTNGDGIIDGFTDLDGDGLSDNVDPSQGGTPLPVPDTDGDGTPDYLDLDSDNDGITDVTEAGGTDANGDGIIDGFTDLDADGLSDNVDPTQGGTPLPIPDTDGDGTPDFLDLDSDNDGITDVTEAGGTDANGDGIIDGYADTDGDGLSDNVDPNNGGTPLPTPDTDGDGNPDYLDLDSDNDGITDVTEAGGTDANGDGIIDGFADTDGDGLSDNVDPNNGGTPLPVPDTDGDGHNDYLDLDSDNDGITDVTEAGGTDANGDGIIDGFADTDNDGLSDNVDPNNGGTPLPVPDTDGDGHNDYIDLDSDNDGITDVTEAGGTDANGDGIIDGFTDLDNDGLSDNVDPTQGGTPLPVPDTDGDGQPNYIDVDSDNDGITDVTENGLTDANGDGIIDGFTDADGDGYNDAQDPSQGGTPVVLVNTDGDGQPNYLDLDSDNDGITDVTEAGGTDANGDGQIDGFADVDGDGLSDNVDPSQGGTPLPIPNTDGDGLPDYLDLDSDNDGITDVTEAGGTDANGDGIIDGFADVDNDGLSDNVDPSQGGTPLPVPDFDGDGQANYIDVDSDNDGITDVTENGLSDTNGDGIIDGFTDADGDGYNDAQDPTQGGTPVVFVNTDGDGQVDYLDLDSDNDGITDVTEAGGTDANGDGFIDGFADVDNDGLSDNVDPSQGGTPLPVGDNDGDGHPNYLDLDSDNDGVTDVTEAGGTDANGDGIIDGFADTDNDGLSDNVDPNNGGTPLPVPDTDGDGVDNYIDVDSDNDGITDVMENGGADADGNGQIDGYADVDNDGLSDNVDPNAGGTPLVVLNFDGDGAPNYLDIDSDNDGITDLIETGGTDTNGDGMVDGNTDVDGDGQNDTVDPSQGGTPNTSTGADTNSDGRPDSYPNDNTDNSGNPDYLDIDADNDGIVDNIEGMASFSYIPPTGNDTDGDGLDDAYDTINGFGGAGVTPVNTDGTDTPDYIDLDTDNDGISDNIEGWDTTGDNVADTTPSGNDADNDGLDDAYDVNDTAVNPTNGTVPTSYPNLDDVTNPELDWREIEDHDNDGVPDVNDPDDDNDGVLDVVEGPGDTDGDGIPDYFDLDSDNDGITDVLENGLADADGDGIVDGFTDVDNDGLNDAQDPSEGGTPVTPVDTDGDGHPDYTDLDSDNDGITDVTEAGGTDVNGDGLIDGYTDTDGDGLSDNVDPTVGGTPLPTPDTDGDGIDNFLDLDSDNDGITDVTEAGGTDANGDGLIDGYTDTDGDGLSDNVDPTVGGTPLPTPDSDGDGHDDYIDVDSDNDGVTDVTEAGGTDANGDGQIDGFADTDNDGLSDNVDPTVGGTPLNPADTDGDSVPNYLDVDSDNDGITDVMENGGADADGNGQIDGFTDADGDGLSDDVDPSQGGTILTVLNMDGDGAPNYLDIDSDNDGITDLIETGGTDANGDGMVDGNADIDGDGQIDTVDPSQGGTPNTTTGADTNSDGRPDSYPNDNTDNNGNPDYLDIDADNDGIVDNIEGQATIGWITPTGNDTDGDGLDDAYDTNTGFGGAGLTPWNTDGTDTPDYIDTDSDNDTFSDLEEGNDFNNDGQPDTPPSGNDTDGDGLDDAYDNVATSGVNNITNNDGPATSTTFPNMDTPGTTELDWREARDWDNDGIPDVDDIDDDNDGITDVTENATAGNGGDTDGDGIPDQFDLDSDNDGIADVIEAGGPDPDNDGIVGTGPITDVNNDGLNDAQGPNGLTPPDFDGDGNPDFQDLDSDNDGISDLSESGRPLTDDANSDGVLDGPDTDNDGIMDNADNTNGGSFVNSPPDTDGDSHPDYTDLDSDNDGINDIIESGNEAADANSDGVVDGVDTDDDGIMDAADGSSTYGDDANTNDDPVDTDSDNVPDYQDLDSDNDGIDDIIEAGNGAMDANEDGIVDGVDTDGDGIIDAADGQNGTYGDAPSANDDPVDTDGDGVPDYQDLDADNDGIDDVIEGGNANLDTNGDGIVDGPDTDGDGIIDTVDGNNGTFGDAPGAGTNTPPDTDGDGVPDYQDLDSDNDGISDVIEGGNGDLDANGDGVIDGVDTDGDGIIDTVDGNNGTWGDGPGAGTDTPPDTDGDGIPNYQDLDSDGDGINDGINDETPLEDCDGDGLNNYLDPDPCGLDIPQGFSANGDGQNDFFEIKGINAYPDNKVTIFNRWGNIVWEGTGYNNSTVRWDGTNTNSMSLGNGLAPEGTYFYMIDLNGDGTDVRSGYVYLNTK